MEAKSKAAMVVILPLYSVPNKPASGSAITTSLVTTTGVCVVSMSDKWVRTRPLRPKKEARSASARMRHVSALTQLRTAISRTLSANRTALARTTASTHSMAVFARHTSSASQTRRASAGRQSETVTPIAASTAAARVIASIWTFLSGTLRKSIQHHRCSVTNSWAYSPWSP